MGGAIEMVYQYRQLLAKCESSAGLTLDEIERFSTLADGLASPGRVDLEAHMRGKKYVDPVTVLVLGLSGAVCADCPYLEEGQTIELRISDADFSYRFAARVSWAREGDDETYEAGLAFEGAPVLVRSTREFPVHELQTAAA